MRTSEQRHVVIPAHAGIQFLKNLGPRLRGDDVRKRSGGLFLICAFVALANVACGFHLRGEGSVTLPEWLSRLRVVMPGSKIENEPVLVLLINALRSDPKITVTDDPDAPALLILGESTSTTVLSVSTSGRASGYTLRYDVHYKVVDAKGKELLKPQTVRLLRDYSFDPVNVLAREHEEQELVSTLRQDAVQQILRRLSRAVPLAQS